MKKGLWLLLPLLWLSHIAGAQDLQAVRMLRTSQKTLASLQDFHARFSYVIDNPEMPRATPRAGHIRYKKGKYAILLSDQEVYCDLETQWIYLVPDKEVNVMPYDPEEGVTLESIFRIYEASAKSRYDGQERIHGNTCERIYLAITDPSLDYNQAYVWINAASMLIEKVALIDRKQTTTTYEFWDIKTNNGFSDSDFRFDPSKYPGVVIYD
ncbi:MAG: hypothetical protein OHK0039_22700 [Bacteroidia bacterium]